MDRLLLIASWTGTFPDTKQRLFLPRVRKAIQNMISISVRCSQGLLGTANIFNVDIIPRTSKWNDFLKISIGAGWCLSACQDYHLDTNILICPALKSKTAIVCSQLLTELNRSWITVLFVQDFSICPRSEGIPKTFLFNYKWFRVPT